MSEADDAGLIPTAAGAKGPYQNPDYPFVWLRREQSCAWEETYYGYRCTTCGAFVPFGCEPWAPDDDGADPDD